MGQRYHIFHSLLPTPSSISLNYLGICWEFSSNMKINPNPPPNPTSSFSRDREMDLPKEIQPRLELRSSDPKSNQICEFFCFLFHLNYPNPPLSEKFLPFLVSRLLLNCLNIQIFTVLLPCPYSISAGLPNATLRSPE